MAAGYIAIRRRDGNLVRFYRMPGGRPSPEVEERGVQLVEVSGVSPGRVVTEHREEAVSGEPETGSEQFCRGCGAPVAILTFEWGRAPYCSRCGWRGNAVGTS